MTIQTIPLHLLVPSKANVRRTGKTDGIGELAASIAAHGLRQNLNVRSSNDGAHFEVIAGGRRLRALKMLVKAGTLAGDAPVSCLVLGEGDDAGEISLVENAVRMAMHPDDQFEAFRALIEDKGCRVEDVAARFGITPAVVRQRLKLAAVSPKLRALFRKGEMDLDHVMAFTVSDDHAAQEAVWRDLPDWNRSPSRIKDALTEDSIAAADRLARFITVAAYVDAGGAIARDLFDQENEGFLTDRELVMQLAEAKLEREADAVRAEGWKWVKTEAVRAYGVYYDRLRGKPTAESRARSGALIRIAHDGSVEIERGLIDPDDAKAEAKRLKAGEGETATPKRTGYSAALLEDLTAHRTAAIRIELTRNPHAALAVTVHALALSLVYAGGAESCLDLRATSNTLERHIGVRDDSPAHKAMAEEGEHWGDRLPGEASDLMAWCLAQPQDTLLDLLAFLAALTVDAVQSKQGRGRTHDHADQIAAFLALDMRQWWTPSVEGFYGRLSKAALVEAVTEAGVTADAPFDSVKKAEAAAMAAKALKDSLWLPLPLRSVS